MSAMRTRLKHGLAQAPRVGAPRGVTILTYHRVGGGTEEELDLGIDAFDEQLAVLADHDVVSIDDALDALDRGDDRHRVVLTFDDGFEEVATTAWPRLAARALPFTLFLATGYLDAPMRWEGSTAAAIGTGMSWAQVRELVGSGLCTLGNHTHTHAHPTRLGLHELDRCDEEILAATGVRPRHFAYPWGIPVPRMEPELRRRFRSCVTGELGRNGPDQDRARLRRIPVRRTDPIGFFDAKLTGALVAERTYQVAVRTAKRLTARR